MPYKTTQLGQRFKKKKSIYTYFRQFQGPESKTKNEICEKTRIFVNEL